MHEMYCTPSVPSRRGLLAAGAGFAGIATAPLFAAQAVAAGTSATLDQLKRAERDPAHRVLLKGGIVLSLDPHVGDFANGDVLIQGRAPRIAARYARASRLKTRRAWGSNPSLQRGTGDPGSAQAERKVVRVNRHSRSVPWADAAESVFCS
jgi:hypothetical protein